MPMYRLHFDTFPAQPDKFVSDAYTLLTLAKTRHWDMVYPRTGGLMSAYKKPDQWDPAGAGMPNVALWTTANTMFGNQTIDQLFATLENDYEWLATSTPPPPMLPPVVPPLIPAIPLPPAPPAPPLPPTVPTSPNGNAGQTDVPVYRLIIISAPGRVDSGATYANCSRDYPAGCYPAQFASVDEAFAYAEAHNEIPYVVANEQEAWDIVEGKKKIGQGLDIKTIAIGGLLVYAALRILK